MIDACIQVGSAGPGFQVTCRSVQMVPFEVPGWSVSAPLASVAKSRVSKKRKQPGGDLQKNHSIANLETLVKTLTASDESVRSASKKRRRKGEEKSHDPRIKDDIKKSAETAAVSVSKPTQSKRKTRVNISSSSPAVSNEKKMDHTALTALQKGMKQSLDGARFR
jgi:ribosomal RNA-processing protein 8